jgi:hypothetical protein
MNSAVHEHGVVTGLDWTRKYPAIAAAIASLPDRQAYPRCFNSLDAPRDRFAVDSPLERNGFEHSVPVRQAKLTRSCR